MIPDTNRRLNLPTSLVMRELSEVKVCLKFASCIKTILMQNVAPLYYKTGQCFTTNYKMKRKNYLCLKIVTHEAIKKLLTKKCIKKVV